MVYLVNLQMVHYQLLDPWLRSVLHFLILIYYLLKKPPSLFQEKMQRLLLQTRELVLFKFCYVEELFFNNDLSHHKLLLFMVRILFDLCFSGIIGPYFLDWDLLNLFLCVWIGVKSVFWCNLREILINFSMSSHFGEVWLFCFYAIGVKFVIWARIYMWIIILFWLPHFSLKIIFFLRP